jgi:ATP-dependent Clp protease ATP-binding subunit ClpA
MTFSKEFNNLTKDSRALAITYGWSYLTSCHFLLGILQSDNLPHSIFKAKNWNFEQLSTALIKKENEATKGKYHLTKELETSLKNAYYYAWIYGATEIKPEHVIFAMIADSKSDAGNYLNAIGMNYTEFKMEHQSRNNIKANPLLEWIGKNKLAIQLGIPMLIFKLMKK